MDSTAGKRTPTVNRRADGELDMCQDSWTLHVSPNHDEGVNRIDAAGTRLAKSKPVSNRHHPEENRMSVSRRHTLGAALAAAALASLPAPALAQAKLKVAAIYTV